MYGKLYTTFINQIENTDKLSDTAALFAAW